MNQDNKSEPNDASLVAAIVGMVAEEVAMGKYDNWVPVPKPPLGSVVKFDDQEPKP